MTRGRRVSGLIRFTLGCCGFLLGVSPALAAPPSNTAYRLEVTGRTGAADGACFLLHEQRWEGEYVEYFVTSARLFDPSVIGQVPLALINVRVVAGDDFALETNGTNVVVSDAAEGGFDLAIVRMFSSEPLTPAPVSLDPIEPGRMFIAESGAGAAVMFGRIKAVSTTLAVGEATMGGVRGLIGAPATIGGRVFGVLTDYDAHNAPIVALLSGARDFLADYAPGWTSVVLSTTPVTGTATIPGEGPRSFRMGDVAVLVLRDEVVKLRFSIVGNAVMDEPRPRTPPLVAFGVEMFKTPRP